MIKTKALNYQFKRTYSDAGFKIKKVGTDEIYDDAVDLLTSTFEYEETDISVDIN